MQFINNLRGIAILLIVFTHAISAVPQPGDIGSFLDYVFGSGTVIFMFISGYLFSSTLDGFDYLPYLKNKFLSVVLPYLIITCPAVLMYALALKTSHAWIDMDWFVNDLNPFERYVFMTVTGAALGPLWFIPMVILYFIAAPAFKAVARSNLLIPLLLATLVAAIMIGRPDNNNNPFQSFVFYLPPYLLGIAAHVHIGSIMRLKPASLLLLLGYLALYAISYFVVYTETFRPDSTITMVLYLPLVIIMTAFCAHYLDKRNVWIDMFARLSFFIFFIHGYFSGMERMTLRRLGFVEAIENPGLEIVVIVATFLMIIVMSLSAYIVLKFMLRDKSRHLIGG
ncbi:acyltransferase [Rhizobium sp. RM]|uniref:acyltransferase family protein n=1 Tax=Rhizobium sp. RM TaxID=2748079 RepID=UPI00110DB7D3|nr:acyltransferase [Rhizobium sp. RM]NWJ24332.1 acyltransferase [Rhizobium sp. RM]TMV21115.1 acyltransferase [Rhizobium sp. Td3]